MARILVIDDEEDIRNMLRHMLESANHQVDVASDGQRGIECYRETPADLIITDIVMPGKDGLETIRELRRSDPEVRIIAMAGYGEESLPRARELGASHTVHKPFQIEDFLQVVERLLEK